MSFEDRHDAGQRLANKLSHYRDEKPVVLALPRGGVVIGYEVASRLNAPLDVIVARKLGAPGQPELGIGAVAPNGVRILNHNVIRLLGVSAKEIEDATRKEVVEVQRRLKLYRGDRPTPDIRNRTVILVDDGLATGITARAAIRSIRQLRPERIILAVPVGEPETIDALRSEVDDLVCLEAPLDFMAVGAWYRNFQQVSDEEVIHLLERAQHRMTERIT